MGSGYRDFTAGAVLTADQVDGYLMRQSVMTFADASARDTALSGVLDEGMHAYLEDTDLLTFYTGSAWRATRGYGVFQHDGSAVPNNTSTALTLTAVNDPSPWLSGGNAVPTLNGWYQIAAACIWPTTASNRFLMAIRKNGTDIVTGISNVDGPSAGSPTNQISTSVFLNGSTDAIDCRVLHVVGSDQTPDVLITLTYLGQ